MDSICRAEKLHSLTKLLTVSSLGMCIAVIGITTAIVIRQGNKSPTPKQEHNSSNEVCVKCEKLQNISDIHNTEQTISRLIKRTDNGSQLCCANSEELFSVLLATILKVQETKTAPETKTRSQYKFTPVSVHKQILSVDISEINLTAPYFNGGEQHFPVTFNESFNDPLTEHVRGAVVRNKSIEINYSGLYYVYFSIHMVNKFKTEPDKLKALFQYVNRISTDKSDILQTSYTVDSDGIVPETAYAGGVFYLQKGDHIEVCVNALGLVNYTKESTFLGLFMISNDSGPYGIMFKSRCTEMCTSLGVIGLGLVNYSKEFTFLGLFMISNDSGPYFNGGEEHFPVTFNKSFNDPLTENFCGAVVRDKPIEINYFGLYYFTSVFT